MKWTVLRSLVVFAAISAMVGCASTRPDTAVRPSVGSPQPRPIQPYAQQPAPPPNQYGAHVPSAPYPYPGPVNTARAPYPEQPYYPLPPGDDSFRPAAGAYPPAGRTWGPEKPEDQFEEKQPKRYKFGSSGWKHSSSSPDSADPQTEMITTQ
jgi:hypothetical protein